MFRNRLENNTEHWNALLLSLRELIEWVIRKDTELTSLGPIRGDLSTLIKQQVQLDYDPCFFFLWNVLFLRYWTMLYNEHIT